MAGGGRQLCVPASQRVLLQVFALAERMGAVHGRTAGWPMEQPGAVPTEVSGAGAAVSLVGSPTATEQNRRRRAKALLVDDFALLI